MAAFTPSAAPQRDRIELYLANMPPRSRRKQKTGAAAEPPPAEAGECLLLLLPEDLLVAVLDKLGRGLVTADRPWSAEERVLGNAMANAAQRPAVSAALCLREHARAIARAEHSCSAMRRSCGSVWRRMLQQHRLGYGGVELAAPTGGNSWKELLEAATAQPTRLVCSAAVAAGVLPLRCRGLAAQFRGRLGSDQAATH